MWIGKRWASALLIRSAATRNATATILRLRTGTVVSARRTQLAARSPSEPVLRNEPNPGETDAGARLFCETNPISRPAVRSSRFCGTNPIRMRPPSCKLSKNLAAARMITLNSQESAFRVQRGLMPLDKHIPTTLLIPLYQTVQQNRMSGNRKRLLLQDAGFDSRRDCMVQPTHVVALISANLSRVVFPSRNSGMVTEEASGFADRRELLVNTGASAIPISVLEELLPENLRSGIRPVPRRVSPCGGGSGTNLRWRTRIRPG